MKWADIALRFLLWPRDRETISGDLIEEYREEVLPDRGALRARLWYARQVASFVSPVAWGLTIGIVAGALQLIDTAIDPLADDTAGVMLSIVGTLLLLFTMASYVASLRSEHFRDAILAGLLVGLAAFAVLHLSAIVRVNVFLDQIQYRGDWTNLVDRFHASRFQSLRAYANYEYVSGTPLLLAIGGGAGAVCGMVSGAIHKVLRTA
jgi:hypothetical protein